MLYYKYLFIYLFILYFCLFFFVGLWFNIVLVHIYFNNFMTHHLYMFLFEFFVRPLSSYEGERKMRLACAKRGKKSEARTLQKDCSSFLPILKDVRQIFTPCLIDLSNETDSRW